MSGALLIRDPLIIYLSINTRTPSQPRNSFSLRGRGSPLSDRDFTKHSIVRISDISLQHKILIQRINQRLRLSCHCIRKSYLSHCRWIQQFECLNRCPSARWVKRCRKNLNSISYRRFHARRRITLHYYQHAGTLRKIYCTLLYRPLLRPRWSRRRWRTNGSSMLMIAPRGLTRRSRKS